MSDGGYDDYDDVEYMFFGEEEEPDLADDLAEHSMYSPIWQDLPVEELKDHCSDWEYYSDDYFDDDRRMAKQEDQELFANQDAAVMKRGKKRKLDEARDSPCRGLAKKALESCVRGTVWKTEGPPKPKVYSPGQDTPVVLHLQAQQDLVAFNSRSRKAQHEMEDNETWANDMGLADMGLMNAQGRLTRVATDERQVVNGQDDREHDDEYAVGDDMVELEEETDMPDIDITKEVLDTPDAQSALDPINLQISKQEFTDETVEPPSKRRRTRQAVKSPPSEVLPTPPESTITSETSALTLKETASRTSTGEDSSASTDKPAKRGRGRPRKQPEPTSTERPALANKKRKAEDEEQTAARSTSSHRSKKVAVSKGTGRR